MISKLQTIFKFGAFVVVIVMTVIFFSTDLNVYIYYLAYEVQYDFTTL